MADLVSRLLEAIGETERLALIAKDNTEGEWGPSTWGVAATSIVLYDKSGRLAVGSVSHIERHDPSSVLRRCAADRKLVDLHGIIHRDIGWLEWDEGEHAEMYAELPVCGLCVPKHSSFPRREDVPEGPCRTVRILAEGYGLSDHQEGGDRG